MEAPFEHGCRPAIVGRMRGSGGRGCLPGVCQGGRISIPTEILSDWFIGINRLRISHRKIGRELVRAIRGTYLGRLDPVSVAKMEKEWGVEAKTLLEAARVATIDDVIPLGGENA